LTDIVIFKFLKPNDTSKYLEVGFKDGLEQGIILVLRVLQIL